LDFADPATKTAMDDWVSRATGGRIDRMIEHIPADAALYLLNAIHFRGDWRDQFSESETRPAPFIRDDGVIREVPMMDGKVGYRTLFGHHSGGRRAAVATGRKRHSARRGGRQGFSMIRYQSTRRVWKPMGSGSSASVSATSREPVIWKATSRSWISREPR
jgi:hypothetical protein